jgi:DNA-binding NtrC family response regulator
MLKLEKFDLVISDVKMPEIDGITLLGLIRDAHPHMPVLLITGVASPEVVGEADPDGFLAKPFRISHIEEMIEATLSARKKPV